MRDTTRYAFRSCALCRLPWSICFPVTLYLPRGTFHSVDSDVESLHLSIGFTPLTVREAVIAPLDHLSDADRTLRLTAGNRLAFQLRGAEESVLYIANTARFAVRDIPGGLRDDARLSLARRFVEMGFLEPAADALPRQPEERSRPSEPLGGS